MFLVRRSILYTPTKTLNRIRSVSIMSQTLKKERNESLKELEELFLVDDSFDDVFWENGSGSKKEDFKGIDDDELIMLTTPRKLKNSDLIDDLPLKDIDFNKDDSFVLTSSMINQLEKPKLVKQSSKLTNSTIDTSPVWHRHETWFKVENRSSQPVQNRTAKTPVIPSSPPDESSIPSPDLVQLTKSSEIAKNMIQKRNITTSLRASARIRNSTIELMTQVPQINMDITNDSFTTTKNLEKNVKPVILSEEQLKVIEILKQGQSLFYTGSAGTGKSVLLRSLIKTLRRQHGFDLVGVTASTGLALCNIGGSTLHSFTGIGLGNGDVKSLVKRIKKSKKNFKKWKSLKALIIDEISMIDGELLDKLNEIGKNLRKSDKPFGGIQLIVCGDFYQLPPVAKDKALQFAFESKSWKEAVKITIILQKVFRQQGDAKFIDMLNDIRAGVITEESAYEFSKLSRPLPTDDEIDATELFPTRYEVDLANNDRLRKINEPIVQFNSSDSGTIDDDVTLQKLLNNFLAPKVLQLKKGAQVMMIKNIDETLVNGSLGRVIDFIDPDTYMFYNRLIENEEIDEAELEKKLKSLPKSDLESRYLNEEKSAQLDDSIFDFYKYLKVDKENELQMLDIEHKKSLINTLHQASKGRRLPLVRFKLTDGNTRDVLVEAEKFEVEDPLNEHVPIASRQQLPLILAWALSIHKSQGQTLSKVKVNLQRIFEKGQAYVALSRAVSRDGLQILNFNPMKIMAHPRVIEFYTSLVSVDDVEIDNKRESPQGVDEYVSKRPKNYSNFIDLDDSDFLSE